MIFFFTVMLQISISCVSFIFTKTLLEKEKAGNLRLFHAVFKKETKIISRKKKWVGRIGHLWLSFYIDFLRRPMFPTIRIIVDKFIFNRTEKTTSEIIDVTSLNYLLRLSDGGWFIAVAVKTKEIIDQEYGAHWAISPGRDKRLLLQPIQVKKNRRLKMQICPNFSWH